MTEFVIIEFTVMVILWAFFAISGGIIFYKGLVGGIIRRRIFTMSKAKTCVEGRKAVYFGIWYMVLGAACLWVTVDWIFRELS